MFFSSEGSVLESRPDIPIVALPGIDDWYPPQRKSFAMLRYMHDHYRDRFRYFMRVDDDIYIRGDILGRFLHSINSTGRALFIGQVCKRLVKAIDIYTYDMQHVYTAAYFVNLLNCLILGSTPVTINSRQRI